MRANTSALATAPAVNTSSAAKRLAESIARGLHDAGTRVVYGVPGGGNNLDLIGACETAGIRFVLAHGETAAAIMASADAEITGAPGACLVTRGPGAASAANGAAQAMLDRTALALITDAVPWRDHDRISHQRIDQQALFGPLTKWSGAIAADGADDAIARILRHAGAPAPGPVHLDFLPDAVRPTVPSTRALPCSGDRAALVRLLKRSRSPVFALGVGARRATAELRELIAGQPWPVLTTYKAKGTIPDSWPNCAGLLTGATVEARVLEAADLIVGVGLDPVELIPASWRHEGPLVTLGEWPLTDRYFVPEHELVGPLAELLELVSDALPSVFDGGFVGRAERLVVGERLAATPAVGVGPQHVVLAAQAAAPAGTVATVDAGAHMLVAMPLWESEAPEEVMVSSGLATMGYALPAAIAAAVAQPERQVICFVGDGGLGMTLAELETVSRLGLRLCVVVFNDSALSLIEIKQEPLGHGGTNAVRYRATDFAGIAESCGIASRRVGAPSELDGAFAVALARDGPFLLDVEVDPSGYPEIMSTIRGGRA